MSSMATILPNDHGPDETVRYLLANADIELGAGASYDTDDRRVLSAAEAHPWLKVEYPVVDEADYARPSRSVPYEDDVLAAVNSVAFDPEAIRETERAKSSGNSEPLAVDSGLDQSEVEFVGRTGVTLAADDEEAPEPAPSDDETPEEGDK